MVGGTLAVALAQLSWLGRLLRVRVRVRVRVGVRVRIRGRVRDKVRASVRVRARARAKARVRVRVSVRNRVRVRVTVSPAWPPRRCGRDPAAWGTRLAGAASGSGRTWLVLVLGC